MQKHLDSHDGLHVNIYESGYSSDDQTNRLESILAELTGELKEVIIEAKKCAPIRIEAGRADLYTFVSEECGANGFSTGLAKFAPGNCLPYHTHEFSEAVTVVEGQARILVEGRTYLLKANDCVHLPKGTPHQVENGHRTDNLVAHWSFATARPTRTLVENPRAFTDIERENPSAGDPETIIRYEDRATYELSQGAYFLDLFASRFGSVGICGGHGRFNPGASLPCHIHDFDESITIVEGTAACLVQGRRYELSRCDTAFIPRGLPHRFLNLSDKEMAMVWVYAGSEPDRRMVNTQYCSGELAWPGAESA